MAYVAPETTGVWCLYGVPIDGPAEASVRLSPIPVPGGDVWGSFEFSPDGSRIVYIADQDTNNLVELYSVGAESGPVTKLNLPISPPGDAIYFFAISPDSSRVVYLVSGYGGRSDLFSVPIDGGESILLAHGAHQQIEITDDSKSVLYSEDGVLKMQPLTGGPSLTLSAGKESDPRVYDFVRSADDQFVVFPQAAPYPSYELLSYSLSSGESTVIGGPGAGEPLLPGIWLATSPDNSTVVYSIHKTRYDPYDLFSVPIQGGQSTKLNLEESLSDGFHGPLLISPDSSRVLYLQARTLLGRDELLSVPLTGGPSIRLSPLPFLGGVTWFTLSPDGARVYFTVDRSLPNRPEELVLYASPLDAGEPIALNGNLRQGGTIVWRSVVAAPNSLDVLHLADEAGTGRVELYVSDHCTFCNGFESGDTSRWAGTEP
ncbi:MAG: TolB family protein [Thermoanaerobaculia bacterium]